MSKLPVLPNAAYDDGDHRHGWFAQRSRISRTVVSFRRHILFVGLGLVLGVAVAGSGPALSGGLPSGSDVATATTFGTGLTIQRPGSTVQGDVLVASISARLSGTSSITPPNGWSLIRRDSNAPPYLPLTQALYYKVADAGDPTSYTWSLAASVSAAGA